MEYNYQNSADDFSVKYTLVIPEETPSGYQFTEKESAFLNELEDAYDDIERLTNQADGYDYALAVSSGILAGLIDSFFVGEWDFKNAKKWANIEVNKKIIEFAKSKPHYDYENNTYCNYIDWCNDTGKNGRRKKRDSNRLASAVEFLEKYYKLPGDKVDVSAALQQKDKSKVNISVALQKKDKSKINISASSHHLDDFCHHPTPIGMLCCILVQFTGEGRYYYVGMDDNNVLRKGKFVQNVVVNEYGKLVSSDSYGKVFSGIVNWFFNAAKTLQNREGHLMSDMAGSIKSAKNKKTGAGIPGTVISTLNELSALPCFKDPNFALNFKNAYMYGIGDTGSKLDLGIFNNLFEGAVNKVDTRTEMAVGHELKRQAVPVIINEIIVRAFYFIRRFIEQMKVKKSLMELDWKKLLPANNRTIARMMTVSTGTFCVVDMGDAAIRAGVESKGALPVFAGKFILRVNFVGMGRFTVAVGSDLYMEARKKRLEIAVASGEVGATAIQTKQVMVETSEMNNETNKKLDKLKSLSADMDKLKF